MKCVKVTNVINDFAMLANSQFVENRVYDEEMEDIVAANQDLNINENNSKPKDDEIVPKIKAAVSLGLNFLSDRYSDVNNQVSIGESDDEDDVINNLVARPTKDNFSKRTLPYLIGSDDYIRDNYVGLSFEEETSPIDLTKNNEFDDGNEQMNNSPNENITVETVSSPSSIPPPPPSPVPSLSGAINMPKKTEENDEEDDIFTSKSSKKTNQNGDIRDQLSSLFGTTRKENLFDNEEDEDEDDDIFVSKPKPNKQITLKTETPVKKDAQQSPSSQTSNTQNKINEIEDEDQGKGDDDLFSPKLNKPKQNYEKTDFKDKLSSIISGANLPKRKESSEAEEDVDDDDDDDDIFTSKNKQKVVNKETISTTKSAANKIHSLFDEDDEDDDDIFSFASKSKPKESTGKQSQKSVNQAPEISHKEQKSKESKIHDIFDESDEDDDDIFSFTSKNKPKVEAKLEKEEKIIHNKEKLVNQEDKISNEKEKLIQKEEKIVNQEEKLVIKQDKIVNEEKPSTQPPKPIQRTTNKQPIIEDQSSDEDDLFTIATKKTENQVKSSRSQSSQSTSSTTITSVTTNMQQKANETNENDDLLNSASKNDFKNKLSSLLAGPNPLEQRRAQRKRIVNQSDEDEEDIFTNKEHEQVNKDINKEIDEDKKVNKEAVQNVTEEPVNEKVNEDNKVDKEATKPIPARRSVNAQKTKEIQSDDEDDLFNSKIINKQSEKATSNQSEKTTTKQNEKAISNQSEKTITKQNEETTTKQSEKIITKPIETPSSMTNSQKSFQDSDEDDDDIFNFRKKQNDKSNSKGPQLSSIFASTNKQSKINDKLFDESDDDDDLFNFATKKPQTSNKVEKKPKEPKEPKEPQAPITKTQVTKTTNNKPSLFEDDDDDDDDLFNFKK